MRGTRPEARPQHMSDDLKFQLRLTLSDEFAQVARNVPGDPSISTLTDILNRHDAVMKCQFDAFADYVSEAEDNGIENFDLYEWTKKTIDDPARLQFRACGGARARLWASDQEVDGGNPWSPIYRAPWRRAQRRCELPVAAVTSRPGRCQSG